MAPVRMSAATFLLVNWDWRKAAKATLDRQLSRLRPATRLLCICRTLARRLTDNAYDGIHDSVCQRVEDPEVYFRL